MTALKKQRQKFEKIGEVIFNEFYQSTQTWMNIFGEKHGSVNMNFSAHTFRCVGFYEKDGKTEAIFRNMSGRSGGGASQIFAFQLFSIGASDGAKLCKSKIEIPDGYALNSEYISNIDYYINYDFNLHLDEVRGRPLVAKGSTALLKGTITINNVMFAVLQLHKPYHGTETLLKEKCYMLLQFNEQHPEPFSKWTPKEEAK